MVTIGSLRAPTPDKTFLPSDDDRQGANESAGSTGRFYFIFCFKALPKSTANSLCKLPRTKNLPWGWAALGCPWAAPAWALGEN